VSAINVPQDPGPERYEKTYMKKLAWATDIHLNFLKPDQIRRFCYSIREKHADAVLLGGDMGEAHNVVQYLEILERELQCPIYFVLGNHDFYNGSIAGVFEDVRHLSKGSEHLHLLTGEKVVELTEKTCLVGDGLWADGRLGDYESSEVILNDYIIIEELAYVDQDTRLGMLNELGDQAAARLKEGLSLALERYRHIIVLNHVPPFRESCWYDGRISADDWLPHFSCKAAGECLEELMKQHPDKQMTALCGHTHGSGETQVLPNLRVITGGATYGRPSVQEVLEVE